MKHDYEETLRVRGSELRIAVSGDIATAQHDGQLVSRRVGDVGLLVFTAVEGGERVDYDIAVLLSGTVRIFVGRKGQLINSDDPALPRDLTADLWTAAPCRAGGLTPRPAP